MISSSTLGLVSALEVPRDTDLSSLSSLGIESGPETTETVKQFIRKFSTRGLNEGVLHVYQLLLEHTVFLHATLEDGLAMDGSGGKVHPSITIKIIDPDTLREVGEGEMGEVWVHSEGNPAGIWGREELYKGWFHAKLEGDEEREYYNTRENGCLISGRFFTTQGDENLMEVGKRWACSTVIEYQIERHFPELRSGGSVAVEWDSTLALAGGSPLSPHSQPPRTGLALFAELQNKELDRYALSEKIAARIGLEFHVETLLVVLLPLNSIPHTECGERDRSICKEKLLSGTLQVIHQWSPSTSGNRAAVKPECVPLPTTPIPPRDIATPMQEQSPPAVPELKLVASPTTEELSAAVPRKESRFCLEDAPPKSPDCSAVEETATTPRVDHLAPPGAGERELGRGLVGQEEEVLSIISDILDEEVEMDTNIWEIGCDSLSALEISGKLERHLGFSVEPHLLFAYQTPRALLEKLKRTLLHLCSPVGATEPISEGGVAQLGSVTRPLIPSQEDEVAIVGVACRFPGCSSPETLWELLTEKRVCISHFQDPKTGKSIHGGFTEKMANFDREWFNVSEKEASRMDPQQSILLHTVSECLLRSGYTSLDEVRGSRIGVFVGFWGSDARAMSLASEKPPPYTSYIGTMTANRISYTLDLKGPSMAVDTACAASLTALEIACCFIHQGKCSEALVGGVNALLDPRVFDVSSVMGATSLRGESRVFDEGADGYVRGEGCGVVLLKSVRGALRHGNRILAVVKSVESLHNGVSATLTAPNKQSQSLLLRRSLSSAMMWQGDISYLEAHGTGTPLGDPMEISAVQEVFGEKGTAREPRVGPLVVGSIKANIGHLEAAAGMAGLIKTVMVLEHAKAPGNAGLHTVNPAMNVNPHTILLPRETVSLDTHFTCGPQSSNLLSAGVSSFGIGGSIASAILQQYSQLPHLGQVHCSLVLDGELGNLSTDQLMAAIQLLRARLCSFNSAYLSCVEAFQRAVKPVRGLASEAYYRHPAYLTFCLLYSVAKTVHAHGPELSFVMGTTLCAEVVVLAVADVLILSDAMRLLLAGMAPQVFNIKFITEEEMQPTMSFLSPTLNQHCLPGRFPPSSLNQLIHAIQRAPLMQSTCNDPAMATSYLSLARRYGSLLVVTFNPHSSVVGRDPGNEDTILQLQSSGLLDHFRESFISLRQHSDRITHSKTQFPSDKAEMPDFYKRYPVRAALRDASLHRPEAKGRDRPPNQSRGEVGDGVRVKHRLSCADESGYLTPTTSAESLKRSTPAASPEKPRPKPHPPITTPTVQTPTEQAVFARLMALIRSDLLPELTLADQEVGERDFKSLGLDSVGLLELQDLILQEWNIDLPLQRMLTDLGSVGALAREVAAHLERGRGEGSYYTVPSTVELNGYSKEKLKSVQGFTVGRCGYGRVEFFGGIDISSVDLSSQLVEMERESIRVCEGSKTSLNRPALVFFDGHTTQGGGGGGGGEERVKKVLESLGESSSLVYSDATTGEIVIKTDKLC